MRFELHAEQSVPAKELAPYADQICTVIFADGSRAPLMSDGAGFFAIVTDGDGGHTIRAISARELSGRLST